MAYQAAPGGAPPPPASAVSQPQQHAPLDTALTRDFPATAHLTRQELEALLYGDESEDIDPATVASVRADPVAPQQQPTRPSDVYFEAFVHTLPTVQQSLKDYDQLLQSIEEKARRNKSLQPQLMDLRGETSRFFAEAQSYDAQWAALAPRIDEAYRRFSPAALHAQLTQGTARLDDQCEALANAYVEGLPEPDLPGEQEGTAGAAGARATDPDMRFVRRFRELRTRYHRRALLAERWSNGTVTWRDE